MEVQTKLDSASKRSDATPIDESPLHPGRSKGCLQLIIDTKASGLSVQTGMPSHASTSSFGVSFLFCGGHQENSNKEILR